MTVGNEAGQRFEAQIMFLRSRLGKDGAYLCVLAGLSVFIFSLFLSWAEAKTSTALEDQGYSTGWSEMGFLCLIPIIYVLFCIIKDIDLQPRIVIMTELCALVALVIFNVVDRSEWITREYTTNYLNYGGSYRSFSGRSHSSGSDLGIGFWLGTFSLLLVSVAALTWSLHKVLEKPPVILSSDDAEPIVQLKTLHVDPQALENKCVVEVQALNQSPTSAESDIKSEFSTFDRINELARLKDRGLITSEEFQRQKLLIFDAQSPSNWSHKIKLFIITAIIIALFTALIVSWLYFNGFSDPAGSVAVEHIQETVEADPPPVISADPDQLKTVDPRPQASEATTSNDAPAQYQVGECRSTAITSLTTRLEGFPDSGSAIKYEDGIYGVSYQSVPEVVNSKIGDQVELCLESVPDDCPAGDDRGKIYKATNLRTGEGWLLPDSQHSCGGA